MVVRNLICCLATGGLPVRFLEPCAAPGRCLLMCLCVYVCVHTDARTDVKVYDDVMGVDALNFWGVLSER